MDNSHRRAILSIQERIKTEIEMNEVIVNNPTMPDRVQGEARILVETLKGLNAVIARKLQAADEDAAQI